MAESSDSNATSIPLSALPVLAQIPPISVKLTDGNFLMWQQQVEIAVWGYGLESYLTGEAAPPPQMVSGPAEGKMVLNPEFMSWQRQDRRLAGWLLSSLSESVLVHVVGLRSSRDIWRALETNFASRSTAKVMQYRQQVQNLKKESLPMSEYLNKMKSYFDLLGSVGCKISDAEQILHILGGLGQDYDPVVCSVTSRCEPWTVPDVSSFLLSFESRMETTRNTGGSIDGSQPSLNLLQQSGQKKDSTYYGNKSDSGGGRGNARSPRGGRGGRSFGRGGSKIICQLCEKPGHGAAKCWYRYEQNFTPQQGQMQRGIPQQSQQNFFNPSAHLVQSRPPSVGSQTSGNQSEYNYDVSSSTSWYPDSGATNHVSNDLNNLNISAEYTGGKQLMLGNGVGVHIANIGESYIESESPNFNRKLHLKNLLHVPNITKNLLSVSQFAKDNHVFFEFHPDFCFVKDQFTKEIVLKGTLDKGLYHFLVHQSPIKRSNSSTSFFNQVRDSPTTFSVNAQAPCTRSSSKSCSSLDIDLWHRRLGHASLDVVKFALNGCNLPYHSIKTSSLCHSCCVSKAHRLPYSASNSEFGTPLELIHSDLWGPSPILSRNGFLYYVSFVDHFSRFTWIYLLKHKSEVSGVFKNFKTMAENQFNTKIKMFQSDWGGEFQALTSFLKESGIIHRVSCPHTPQQNGLAERKHRHIVETGLALLSQASLPHRFWDDAFLTAAHLINLLPTKTVKNLSPFEKLFGSKPDYTTLKVFGCLCYPLTRPYNTHKLNYRSDKSTFLGYSPSHKGYKALLPSGKVIVTRDITFDENIFPFQSQSLVNVPAVTLPSAPAVVITNSPLPSHHVDNTSQIPESSPSHLSPPSPFNSSSPDLSVSTDDSPAISPSATSSTLLINDHPNNNAPPPTHNSSSTHHMTTRSKAGIFKPKAYSITISPYLIPKSAIEAIMIPVWKAAMFAEFLALLKNRTWILTTLPPGKNLIGCTWIFKLKMHLSGAIARHKARLVAQGFSQQPGFDFSETFSPVVKPTTIRIILSLAVSLGWSITHLDVNNAFLNGDLGEDIYMKQPFGFEQGGPHLVCKLNKAIYGLKQASRAWFFTVHSVLINLGFTQSKADASMFFRQKGDEVIYLLIYVDDMLITGNSSSSIKRVISQLNSHFSLKDLGEVNLFLGVEVVKTEAGLHLCQTNYIKDLLKKVNMVGAKGCPTPMASTCELSKSIGEPLENQTLYRSTVGALQYATITRPDINFAVNKVSQYMASPLDTHWRAVKRILRYLSGTLDFGIHIRKSNNVVTAFSDSDWAADLDDRRSTSGYCTYFGNNLISWCVKKQNVVARSSTEAEYRSLAQAASEVSWLDSLFHELKIKKNGTSVIWVDNMSAIALASNPVMHARTKHIELDVHFVRDKVLAKQIELRHVPTSDQIADILTKPLSHQSYVKLRNRLGVVSLSTLGLRGRVEGCTEAAASEGMLVESLGAQDPYKTSNIGVLQQGSVLEKATAVLKDQKYSWRDVALQGATINK